MICLLKLFPLILFKISILKVQIKMTNNPILKKMSNVLLVMSTWNHNITLPLLFLSFIFSIMAAFYSCDFRSSSSSVNFSNLFFFYDTHETKWERERGRPTQWLSQDQIRDCDLSMRKVYFDKSIFW